MTFSIIVPNSHIGLLVNRVSHLSPVFTTGEHKGFTRIDLQMPDELDALLEREGADDLVTEFMSGSLSIEELICKVASLPSHTAEPCWN